MTELSATELREKIANGEKFLLDFYAVWCGPCRMLMNTLNNIENELSIPVYTYNVDSDRKFTQDQGIRSVPTMKIFDGGNVVSTKTGALSSNQIKEFAGS